MCIPFLERAVPHARLLEGTHLEEKLARRILGFACVLMNAVPHEERQLRLAELRAQDDAVRPRSPPLRFRLTMCTQIS